MTAAPRPADPGRGTVRFYMAGRGGIAYITGLTCGIPMLMNARRINPERRRQKLVSSMCTVPSTLSNESGGIKSFAPGIAGHAMLLPPARDGPCGTVAGVGNGRPVKGRAGRGPPAWLALRPGAGLSVPCAACFNRQASVLCQRPLL